MVRNSTTVITYNGKTGVTYIRKSESQNPRQGHIMPAVSSYFIPKCRTFLFFSLWQLSTFYHHDHHHRIQKRTIASNRTKQNIQVKLIAHVTCYITQFILDKRRSLACINYNMFDSRTVLESRYKIWCFDSMEGRQQIVDVSQYIDISVGVIKPTINLRKFHLYINITINPFEASMIMLSLFYEKHCTVEKKNQFFFIMKKRMIKDNEKRGLKHHFQSNILPKQLLDVQTNQTFLKNTPLNFTRHPLLWIAFFYRNIM